MLQDNRKDLALRVIEEKIRTFSRVEKAFYASIVFSGIALATGIIFLQTRLLQIQSDMATVNQNISSKQAELSDAQQAVNELTRKEYLTEIAKEDGLTFNNNNIGVIE